MVQLVTALLAPAWMAGSSPARAYVNSVGQTIAGGTSEIQRGIIAQRGLGMPRN
jgi:alkylation response protein AidB-like acyl-CoA dehydrogenase